MERGVEDFGRAERNSRNVPADLPAGRVLSCIKLASVNGAKSDEGHKRTRIMVVKQIRALTLLYEGLTSLCGQIFRPHVTECPGQYSVALSPQSSVYQGLLLLI